tara:strand:+ start:224 stop:799 length:576 start_codon:yes stop_codon:yes gene_type:complete
VNYNFDEMFKIVDVNGGILNDNMCKPIKGRVTEKLITALDPNFKWIDQEYDVLNTATGTRMEVKGMNGCLFTPKNSKKKITKRIRIKNWQGDGAFKNSEDAYDEICSNFDELWIVDTKNYGVAMISSFVLRNHADFLECGDGYDIQICSEFLTYLCTPHDIDVSMTPEEVVTVKKKAFGIIIDMFGKKYKI